MLIPLYFLNPITMVRDIIYYNLFEWASNIFTLPEKQLTIVSHIHPKWDYIPQK